MESLVFGSEEAERIEVQVHGYERAPVGNFYDDNWLLVSVLVRVGAFSGSFDASFLTSEFVALRKSLSSLYESLVGTAHFTTLERQLELELSGDGLGHIGLKGVAIDPAGIGNRLEFEFGMDQGQLPSALRGLDAIISSFPVRAG